LPTRQPLARKVIILTRCKPAQFQLRWDQADLVSYYYYSGELLRPLLAELDDDLTVYYSSDDFDVVRCIDEYYCRIVNTLVSCANNFVPVRRKGFYKFWWDEGLDTLKEAAIESDRLWRSAGRPRFSPIFSERQRARLQYRIRRIREDKAISTSVYTNELNPSRLTKFSNR